MSTSRPINVLPSAQAFPSTEMPKILLLEDSRFIVPTLDGLGAVDYVVKSMPFVDLVKIVGRFSRQILSQTPHRGLRALAERLPA
jgi:hypothetical protein